MERHFDTADEGGRMMLGMLVHTTLAYRDQLVAEKKAPLTIGETREALDSFMTVMRTKRFPDIPNPRARELVMMWLQELKKSIHH